jgi:hypothetical protein
MYYCAVEYPGVLGQENSGSGADRVIRTLGGESQVSKVYTNNTIVYS